MVIWCDEFAQSHSNNDNKNIIYVIMTNFTLKSTIDAYLKLIFIKCRRRKSYKSLLINNNVKMDEYIKTD